MPVSSAPVHLDPLVPRVALLVDPDESARTLYRNFLLPRRYIVEEASDGRLALAKAISERPDVVVMESALPGIDGVGLCTLLRRDPDTANVPIVVVTGEAGAAVHERIRAAGADAIVVKPCDPETLHAQVEALRVQAVDLRSPAVSLRARVERDLIKSAELLERSGHARQRLSKRLQRYFTTSPPNEPRALMCPDCLHEALRYEQSFVGGVNEKFPEQWDDFVCPVCRGSFQYRHRTRKLTAKRD